MARLSVGEGPIRLLETMEVDTIVGVPGIHAIELYRGLGASPIRHAWWCDPIVDLGRW